MEEEEEAGDGGDDDDDDDGNEEQIEGTSGQDTGSNDDDDQDDPFSGPGPSSRGATTKPSNPPNSQLEPPPSTPKGELQGNQAGDGGGSQEEIASGNTIRQGSKALVTLPKGGPLSEGLVFQAGASDQDGRWTSDVPRNAAVLLAFGCGLSFTSAALLEPADPESGSKGIEAGNENRLDSESIMRHAELGIKTRLKSLNLSESTVSPFTVSSKGQQVSIKFPVSPLCDLWCLAVDAVSRLGKLQNNLNGGKVIVSASDSVVAQVMTLEHPDYQIDRHLVENRGQELSSNTLCIGIFEPMIGEKFPVNLSIRYPQRAHAHAHAREHAHTHAHTYTFI
ncbi:hypothetical protein L7F22_004161 [Adiantum nelumboides]|nr:hypothetical protein [Adiantum nelumboides]